MKRFVIVLVGILLSFSVFAQTRVVHGKLTAFNSYLVRNVIVTAKKAKTVVTSDSIGEFSIVCMEKDVIRIKPRTFKPVNKRVGPDTDSLVINLLFIDSESNRELAVGYGYMSREDLNYAVGHLEQEKYDFCNYSDVFELIRGRFSGVTISGGNVYIRGSGSFSGQTQAVYVVNGAYVNSIDWIDPCQIRSIDILKDSNAAIYGTQGGNGVVIIETKR